MNVAGGRHIFCSTVLLIFYFYITESEDNLIYILSWHKIGAFGARIGQSYFVKRNCSFQNCFFTYDRYYFSNMSDFHVVMFNVFNMGFKDPGKLSSPIRSPEQKYIFVAREPPTMYPMLPKYDGFFNYTFTYKLDSDIPWRSLAVKNKTDNKVIAPNIDVKWMDVNDMEPISEEIKNKLENKNIAAAWLVSHCDTYSKREDFVAKLIIELQHYNLSINTTGSMKCVDSYDKPSSPCAYWNKADGTYSHEICYQWISANHYFYLAFENSLCEDYVTEKILTATKNYAIPIVFGGANYSKFVSLNDVYYSVILLLFVYSGWSITTYEPKILKSLLMSFIV